MFPKRKFPFKRPRVVSAPVERPAPRRLTPEQIDSFVEIHATVDPIEAVFIGRWMRGEITREEAGVLIDEAKAAESV